LRYSQLLKYITPHRRTLLAVVALLLAGTAVTLLNPLIAGKLTQVLLAGPDSGGLSIRFILLAWLALMVIKALLSLSSSYLVGSTGALMSAELRSRVYEHMQILPMAYYHERKQGDVLSLLSSDAEAISRFVTDTLVQLLPLVLTFFAAFAIMAWLDPTIAVLAALLMPAYYIVMKLLGRKIRPLSSAWISSLLCANRWSPGDLTSAIPSCSPYPGARYGCLPCSLPPSACSLGPDHYCC